MTAKELSEKAWEKYANNIYAFSYDEFKAFCEQLCKEQRELCAINIDHEAVYCGEGTVITRVLNAPMPEL